MMSHKEWMFCKLVCPIHALDTKKYLMMMMLLLLLLLLLIMDETKAAIVDSILIYLKYSHLFYEITKRDAELLSQNSQSIMTSQAEEDGAN
jgi:accessory gene regulator protein AgrB